MTAVHCAVAAALTVATFAVQAQAAGPTDPQIAAIVVTANQVDIDAGRLAEARAASPEVKAFGRMMVTDHSGVNAAAVALVTRLHVTPEDNPTAESLRKGGQDNVAQLQALQGAAFDKAYIDHEVAYHAAGHFRFAQLADVVLDAVRQPLQIVGRDGPPSARDAQPR